jgi:membrane fusion protein
MSDLFRPEAVAHARGRLSGEVVLAAPLPLRLLGLLLTVVIFLALLFAGWATYTRKASVSGWLVPDLGFIRATTPSTGLVATILVKEGDQVEPGQRLAEIKVASDIAGGNVGDAIAKALQAETDALIAQHQARLAKLEAEAAQTETRIKNLRPELIQVEKQMQLQKERIVLVQKAVTSTEGLADRGFVSQRDLEQRRSTVLAAEQELSVQRRQAVSIEREIGDLEARLTAIPIDIAATRADTQSAQAALGQRRIEAEQRRAVFVVAPMAGTIAALPVTNGQPIGAGATLAVIIPQGGKLEAELLTPSRAIGFIEPGQNVQLQLQAYPYQRFGMLRGMIKSVSSTVLGPSELSIPGLSIQEPVFRVRVSLNRELMDAYGRSYPLQPGMLLSADIMFDRRTLLQWLFDPIYAVGRSS